MTTATTVALTESFWLGLGGVVATLLGGLLAGVLTYRTQKRVAEENARSQLQLKQEEARTQLQLKEEDARSQLQLKQEEEQASARGYRRTEKASAIVAFVEASDAYWQMTNDLWDRVSHNPSTLKSFREETGDAVKNLTRTGVRLELVSGDALRLAVHQYSDALARFAAHAYRDKQWVPPSKALRDEVIAKGREELGYTPAP
ncbi:hypothetical protein ACWGKA_30605 [Streptomyces luteogriseus]